MNASTVLPGKAPKLVNDNKLYILVSERDEIDERLEFALYHTKLRSTKVDPDFVDICLNAQVCDLRKRRAEVIYELTSRVGFSRAETLSTFDAMCGARIASPILASDGCQINQPSTPPTTP
jgi:hypothetical protein